MSIPLLLLIEDNPDEITLAKIAVKRSGIDCQMLCLTSSTQAFAYLARSAAPHEDIPVLVVLNPLVGHNEGADILRAIRQHEILQSTPVIMLTNSPILENVKKAYDLGANAYIIKSINFEQSVERTRMTLAFWLNVNTVPR